MKRMFPVGGMILVVLLVLGCALPTEPRVSLSDSAIPVDRYLDGLDSLGAPSARALVPALPKVTGGSFDPAVLEAYLAAITGTMRSAFLALASGTEYPVVCLPVSCEGQSGLMWVPYDPAGVLEAPVVCFQHGTQVYRDCAPSRFDPAVSSVLGSPDVAGAFQNYVECTVGALMASTGCVVVMPDYPGFGLSTEPHPYVHQSLGESVRKVYKRSLRVLAGIAGAPSFNGRTYLIGYSEGGFATLAAARVFQKTNVPVTAAVPCAGSYDLCGTMVDQIRDYAVVKVPYYIPYTVFGYASVYAEDDPEDWDYARLLVPPLPGALDEMFSGGHSGAELTAALAPFGYMPWAMLTPALRAELAAGTGPVYRKLRANTLFLSWTPEMVLQMIHCPADDIVPAANAQAAYEAWEGLPNVLPPLWVPPVELPPGLPEIPGLGDTHLLAFPTAMIAGFGFIHGLEAFQP